MKKFICQVCLFIAFFTFFEIASYAQNILEPGVSYVARQYVKNGHAFGISGPEYHSVEIKIYKDGTASGIYSVGLHDYDEDGSQMLKLTGDWSNTSKYDRKVIDIFLKYEDESNYESFHIYVDEDQKAYLRDLNNSPAQLYKKSDLIAEKEKFEIEKRKEEEAKDAERAKKRKIEGDYHDLMESSKVLYEIIDLGLSVKWANVNLDRVFFDSHTWLINGEGYDGMQLDNLGGYYGRYYNSRRYDGFEHIYELYYLYAKNEEGKVIIRPYYDSDKEYVAGGSKHGYPVPSNSGNDVKKALLLSCNPNYPYSTTPDQEQWAEAYQKIQHNPTKAEWQELMDNCIISGVETNPIRENPISLAYFDFKSKENQYLGVKMLRLTSKINGKSIVLPFDPKTGTNYVTSQYLSSSPDEITCVHVDANGLSFLEVNREEYIASRLVFGDINMASLESDIQAAQAKYSNSPSVLEQKQLRDEYEERLTDGMLSIGAPSITVVKDNSSSKLQYEIKAPIISGKITKNSRVMIAVEPDDEYYHKTTIHEANGSTPAYVSYTGSVKDTEELIEEHSVYFISDNQLSNAEGEHFKTIKCDSRYQDLLVRFRYKDDIERYTDFSRFCNIIDYRISKKDLKEHGFNNANDQKTSRQLIVTPTTYFDIFPSNGIKYKSGPAPIPMVGTPKILNIGTFKKGTFSNVEIGFDVVECDYPFEHSQTQSFNLTIKTGDQVIKTKYAKTDGNDRIYVVKKLTAGTPYTLTGYIIDQYGHQYESSETITLNADGTVSTVTSSSYYVRYQLNLSSSGRNKTITIKTASGSTKSVTASGKSFTETIGPVNKGFNARITVKDESGTNSGTTELTIYVSKDGGSFDQKATNQGNSLLYTIED